jgi:uncharacterized OB-fold protein
MIPVELPGCGRLWSWAVIENQEYAPEGFEEFVPYAVGIIELEGNIRVSGRLTDVPRDRFTGQLDRRYLQIGAPFEMMTRIMRKNGDKGLIEYGPLWRPALAAELAMMETASGSF